MRTEPQHLGATKQSARDFTGKPRSSSVGGTSLLKIVLTDLSSLRRMTMINNYKEVLCFTCSKGEGRGVFLVVSLYGALVRV
jgi:hypothetical protein